MIIYTYCIFFISPFTKNTPHAITESNYTLTIPITPYPQISGEEKSTLTWNWKLLSVEVGSLVPKIAFSWDLMKNWWRNLELLAELLWRCKNRGGRRGPAGGVRAAVEGGRGALAGPRGGTGPKLLGLASGEAGLASGRDGPSGKGVRRPKFVFFLFFLIFLVLNYRLGIEFCLGQVWGSFWKQTI